VNTLLIIAIALLGSERYYAPPYVAPTFKPKDPLRVNTSDPIILIRYTAKWCGACKRQNAMLSRLYAEGYPLRTIDVDNPKYGKFLARQPYTILPHWLMVVNGRTWESRRGTVSAGVIKQWFWRAGLRKLTLRAAPRQPAPTYVQSQPRYAMGSAQYPRWPGYARRNASGSWFCEMCGVWH